MERLKAGEDVDVGKPIDWRPILKGAGLGEADIRHMQTVAAMSDAGFKEYTSDQALCEGRQHTKRSERAIARRILRREIAEDGQPNATPPSLEPK